MSTAAPGTTVKTIETPQGPLRYELTRKRVRNLNLRVRPDGSVAVSAPRRVAERDIERFVAERAGWIAAAQQRAAARMPAGPPALSRAECERRFAPVFDAVYRQFAGVLPAGKPAMKLRDMKSRWGVCHMDKNYITLNIRLAEKPFEALEYVVVHEFVHFLHPNHGPGFHAEMARRMPDYRERRRLLR